MVDPVDFLYELVSIPSPSKKERRAARFILKTMKELGFKAKIDKAGNAVGMLKKKEEKSDFLLLFSHMDTVLPQLPVKQKGGRIYGRGSVDAKSALAALLFAAADSDVPYNIMFAGVVEEEIPSSKGIRHLLTYAKPKMAILGEPGGPERIAIAYKGKLLIEGITKGKAAHACREVETPFERACEFYRNLKKAFPAGRPYDSVITNITYASYGSPDALNVIPSELGFAIDVRFPKSISSSSLIKKIKSIAPKDVKIRIKDCLDGVEINQNHLLCNAFTKAIRARGMSPEFIKKMATSDMNITAGAGIPTVSYGPGDSLLSHTSKESVAIKDYLKSIDVLRDVLNGIKIE